MQPANHATLPPTADDAPARAWTPVPELAPADAQRALLPSAGDVGGLDGAWYAPAAPGAPGAPPDPEGAGPSLGPLHGLFTGPRQPAAQLVLDLSDLDQIPQLSLWDRRRVAGDLAARGEDRLSKCCHNVRRTAAASPAAYRTDRGAWSWSQVVRCQEWVCPTCGPRRARDAAAKLAAAFDRWLAPCPLLHTDAWMLTLTVPHAGADDPALTVDTLYASHELLVRDPRYRRFCRRFGIASTVRVLDATFGGGSGAHPHFHVALLPAAAVATAGDRREAALRAWAPDVDVNASDDERARLLALRARIDADRRREDWADAPLVELDAHERASVLEYLVRDVRAAWCEAIYQWTGARPRSSTAACKLTPSEDGAAYFTAWGLSSEVAATPIKTRSHLRLLDAAAAGHPLAAVEYRAWRAATHGRAWVTGMGRTLRRLGLSSEDVDRHRVAEQRKRDNHRRELASLGLAEPLELVRPLSIVVPSMFWPAAAAVGFDAVERLADEADRRGDDPQRAVLDALRAASLQADLSRRRRHCSD